MSLNNQSRLHSACGLLIFLLAVFPHPAVGQNHLDIMVSRRLEMDLVGPVKKITSKIHYNMSDEPEKEVIEFDSFGNLIKESEWDREGTLTNVNSNRYDEANGLLQRVYLTYKDKDTTKNIWDITLNPETRQVASRNRDTGTTNVRTYSENRYLISFKSLDGENKLVRSSRTHRGDDNREIQHTRYDDKNSAEYTYHYKWTDQGFMDKERISYHQEKKERLNVYEYPKVDDRGNWTQQLMIRYDVTEGEPSQMYEKLTLREITYFDDELEVEEIPEEEVQTEEMEDVGEKESTSTNAISGENNE